MQDPKLRNSIEKARKNIKVPSRKPLRMSAFYLRMLNILRNFSRHTLTNQLKDKQLAITKQKDSSDLCFDAQDLHLQHFHEILSEGTLPRRKVWNIRLPKIQNDAFFKKRLTGNPMTHYTIIDLYHKKKPETSLDWQSTSSNHLEGNLSKPSQ